MHVAWLAAGAVVAGVLTASSSPAQHVPFGSHPIGYAAGTTRPSHVTQQAMDDAVRAFYDAWKARYLQPACAPGRYVVAAGVGHGNLTVSEAHGYGMLLAVLLAGHDPDARTVFDGMYAYFRDHPTATHDHLMAWNQSRSCHDVQGRDSATDGDLDIAFALLLADRQWGSCGAVDYHAEALAVLTDVAAGEVDASSRWTLLGDWVDPGDPTYAPSTRSSDWMVDHFRSFANATGDARWTTLLDATYARAATLRASYAAGTGLLPDFVVGAGGTPSPAPPDFLEATTDGAYSYNACRDPWRLATDALVAGEPRARTAVRAITTWIRGATGDDPTRIRAGYALDGTPLPGTDYLSLAFVAPFGVGAMMDATDQTWLNALWDLIVATPLDAGAYYENTLKLLAMVVMSGNWWAPETVAPGACDPGGTPGCPGGGTLVDARIDLVRVGDVPGRQSLALAASALFPNGRRSGFPLEGGAQVHVEDLGAGDAAVYDVPSVPPAAVTGCGPKDLWQVKPAVVQYVNRSGALQPPACPVGSANGFGQLRYRVRGPRDLDVQAKANRATVAGPVIGPLRVTVVQGADGSAAAAGACAASPPLTCQTRGARIRCE